MHRIVTSLAALIVSLCLAQAALAADLNIRASVNPQRAQVGEGMTLTIEIDGAQNVGAPALQIPGFDVRYRGPSTQVSIVNGKMSASVQHIFLITAQQAGRYNLGPFTVDYNGQQYKTTPLAVEIVAPGQAAAPQGNAPLRVVVTVPRNEVYLHERIPLDVTLYVGQVRAGDLQYPVIAGEGFSLERLGEPAQRQEVIDGQTFQVLRFQNILTPLRTGALTIGPTSLTLNVFDKRRGGIFDDPFFSERRPTTVRSEELTLTVLPLPEEGKPASFNGAVGHFTMEVTAGPNEVNVGDPVTLRVSIGGSGNFADVQAPALADSKGFKTYEPKSEQGDPNTRVFEQVLIPNATEVKAVPPVRFSFFDPEKRRYEVLSSEPIALNVKPAQQPQQAAIVAGRGNAVPPPEELGRDIVYIKDEAGSLGRRDRGAGVLFWLWQPLPLAILGAAYWYDRRRSKLTGDVRYARFTQAGRQARQGLHKAAEALQQGSGAVFYDTVAATLRDYLAAKLDLPVGAVDAAAVGNRVPPEIATQLTSLFETCERMRFAPTNQAGNMQAVLAAAEQIVTGIERGKRWAPRALAVLIACLLLRSGSGVAVETAANPQTVFFKANGLYSEGSYAEAAAAYEQLVTAGLESGALYFNLGNAYFKSGAKGTAILNYERALQLLPGDPDIQANLSYARSLTHAEECVSPLWTRLLFPLSQRMSGKRLVALTSLAYTGTCGLFALGLWLQRQRRAFFYAGIASAALTLLTATSWQYRTWAADPAASAVITAGGGTAARFQPSASGTEHFNLPEGSRVDVIERREGWAQVARCDGRRGWIEERSLTRLRPAS